MIQSNPLFQNAKSESTTLISLKGICVQHLGRVVFQDMDFELKTGENWAILGHSGVQKTAFLETLMGHTVLNKGTYERPFATSYLANKQAAGEVHSFRDLMAFVSQKYLFKDKSNQQNFYYQQRYNSMDSEATRSVFEYLSEVPVKNQGPWSTDTVMDLFRLKELAEASLIKLSNGETRRLALAEALIKNPKILLLDQPMTGLDTATKSGFDKILLEIVKSGIQVIMTTNIDEIPTFITHLGVLGKFRFKKRILKENYPEHDFSLKKGFSRSFDLLDRLLVRYRPHSFKTILELNQVNVQYGEHKILHEINWRVVPGERWSLEGPNGAGKSTLLSLIMGEHPQAYANDILLFDRKRGTGESIWDIKKNLGFVAPELSRFFPTHQSCLQVVLSGFFDTIGLYRRPSKEQHALAMDWLKAFELQDVASLRLNQVTLENQRLILLTRALIKWPPLLILDEAAQGMDERQRLYFRETIDRICFQLPLTLIYISHYATDVPRCVNKSLALKEGKIHRIADEGDLKMKI
ncbi:ATP-binding cassette domain-containing protein [Pararhodonellum marinum]|uniref:ATP-binding cassette domain-containing protein n=1 Tax=Pararhodonellum marinum TaxID=2755358 RepID=UPI00188EA630|nr:ATP-binding cassette domain-containing protein [Pararhodonellum marinum]